MDGERARACGPILICSVLVGSSARFTGGRKSKWKGKGKENNGTVAKNPIMQTDKSRLWLLSLLSSILFISVVVSASGMIVVLSTYAVHEEHMLPIVMLHRSLL